jgi:K+-transporting ATPase A subunit
VLRTQAIHPWDHGIQASLPWDVAFNTAVSFVSNTSWQFYAGETSLTTFSQMASIALHSWLSAAVGLATGIAVIRGFARSSGAGLGNFWVDLVRGLLYVLLPLGTLGAADGRGRRGAEPHDRVDRHAGRDQDARIGRRRLLQRELGDAVRERRLAPERRADAADRRGPTPAMQAAGLTGANLEGKEQRFGDAGTALYATVTTSGASGAVNGAMESLSGTGALAPLSLMMTGELAFAGYTGFVQPADAQQFGISFANVMGGLAMLAGRYVPMLAALAVAGAFATRPVMATGRGTLRTDNPTFVSLVLAVVVVVVLLTFAPALLLGSEVQGFGDRLC